MVKNITPAPTDERIIVPWRRVVVCILIVLVGFNLRSVMLAVPPVLPLIQYDLRLSYAATGFLTALPVLVLACMAWPLGLFIERIGSRPSVIIGLVLLASGTFLRALGPSILTLFLFTLLLSLGVVLTQTAIPVLIRHWFPTQIGFVAALFSDGLIIGEAVAAGITIPIMLQLAGKDGWTSTFIFWGLPILALLVLWLLLAPHAHTRQGNTERGQTVIPAGEDNIRELSSKRPRVNAFHLGVLIGGGSLIYFGMNGWIAPYNVAIHQSDLTSSTLAILNAAQLPVSLGVTVFAQKLAGRRVPFIIAGLICGLSICGWIFTPAALEPLWAALLGGSSAFVFTLGIALPPLLAFPDEVARLTGITISLTYAVAFVGPFVGGELWDISNIPTMAFLPVGAASLMLIILGMLLPSRAAFGLEPQAVQAKSTGEILR